MNIPEAITAHPNYNADRSTIGEYYFSIIKYKTDDGHLYPYPGDPFEAFLPEDYDDLPIIEFLLISGGPVDWMRISAEHADEASRKFIEAFVES
ncbi:hypothetical protein [Gordonia aichiensis]|uniref:hypothetical protein n=1 Tax=Gordonia aichiensis TaxID=36820 RepID=UPI003263E29A